MSEFKTYMIQKFSDDISNNGGFHHKAHKGELTIIKNGTTIKLNEEEIKKVVKTAGANFKW